jgi:hypothetical protein
MKARSLILLAGATLATAIGAKIYSEEKAKKEKPAPGPSPAPTTTTEVPKTLQQIAAEAAAAAASRATTSLPWEKPVETNAPATLTVDYLPNPVVLEPGQRYGARLELTGFQTMASPEMIVAPFIGLGFRDVQAYLNDSQLPAEWPRETVLNATSGTRWVQGVWAGGNAAQEFPEQVKKAWRFPSKVA